MTNQCEDGTECEIFLDGICITCLRHENYTPSASSDNDCIIMEECGICCTYWPEAVIQQNICLDCLVIDHIRNEVQNPARKHVHPYTQVPTLTCSLCV